MAHKAVIGDTNGFRARKTLERTALDPRIAEIEGGGMDDGRVFLHAVFGWRFEGENRSRGVSNAADIRDALRTLVQTGD